MYCECVWNDTGMSNLHAKNVSNKLEAGQLHCLSETDESMYFSVEIDLLNSRSSVILAEMD